MLDGRGRMKAAADYEVLSAYLKDAAAGDLLKISAAGPPPFDAIASLKQRNGRPSAKWNAFDAWLGESRKRWQTMFLEDLRRGGAAGKYKRYNGLPLRYAGGKSLAVGHILEHFPKGADCMASPFLGGGSVEIAAAKELGMFVKGYDVFDVLANFWQVALAHPEKLAANLDRRSPSAAEYERVKEKLKLHWRGERKIRGKLELAADYWFNHNLSYGPGFLGWMSKIYECPKRYRRLVDKVRDFKCPLMSVEHGSFEEVMPRHLNEFLYCDPPYYLDDGKMFKGIYPMRNIPVHHRGFDHTRLRDLLRAHRGGFVLSYNDCETIRSMYSGCKIVEVEWQYTLGQGETRIGKNRIEGGLSHVKPSHELLIIGRAKK